MRVNYVIVFTILLLKYSGTADSRILLEGNGYTNILVAISGDIPPPTDGGVDMVETLQNILAETSTVLYEATDKKVYFKSIDILIPSTWNMPNATTTSQISFQQADIRLTSASSNSATGTLPYTLHSGKCGVAGNFITIPTDYVLDSMDNIRVQAKGLVQQWAQLRYGVFEEHGYPNDDLLPYFYRHPEGYDAVTSSNDTLIKGNLKSLSGGDCQVDESGLISNQGDCRFIPSATEQTATASLMGFHWLDSVVKFSDEVNYDRKPPHRQNRLCGSRSSSEVIFELPDFEGLTPNPDQNTVPTFRIIKNLMLPVVYLAIDTSKPTSSANANSKSQNILKSGLKNLFTILNDNNPNILVAWSSFENVDSGAEIYLKEEIAPIKIGEGKNALDAKANNFVYSPNVLTRDVSAAIRDAESRLSQYKDVGGSILYIITSTESVTNDTITETEMAESLLLNKIKLEVAESGPDILTKALSRFSILSQGSYYFQQNWTTVGFFNQISREIDALCRSGLKNERRTILSKIISISNSQPSTGYFLIDDTIGTNTTVVLRSPIEGSFVVTIMNPSGEEITLENEPEVTNWNYVDSDIRITSKRIPNPAAAGRWSYSVAYDRTGCNTCETEPEIQLQIGSSVRSATSLPLPKALSWVSLTAGSDFVDISQHPAVIQTRFDSTAGRLGGLTVTADVVLDSVVVKSVPLTDTGSLDSDISKDGIYSGIFYPEEDGNYTVNIYTADSNSKIDVRMSNRFLDPDQDSYCCGSSLPTTILNNFQSAANGALRFEVINAATPSESSNIVSDIQSNTYGVDDGMVYTALTWTVPLNSMSQVVKYSEDYDQLFDDFETAPTANIVYGSLENVEPGSSVFLYVSAPYNEGKNVYFVVVNTGKDNTKTRSYVVWTEVRPSDNAFTSPGPVTESTSTSIPPLETTTEAITSSLPPTTIVTDPTTVVTDPTTVITDPSTVVTDPTTVVTDPTTIITDPTTVITDYSTVVTDPTTKITDPTTVITDLTTVVTDPTTVITDPSTAVTDPTTVVTDPTTKITDPTTVITDPTTLVTDPTTVITDPSTLVTDPTTVVTDPTTKITDPTTVITDPTTLVTDPITVITDPSTVVTDPTIVVTDPTTKITNPTTAITDPSTLATEPTTTMAFMSTSQQTSSSTDGTTECPEGDCENDNGDAQIGYIIGGVVVGLLVIGGIVGGIIFYKRKQSGNSLPANTVVSEGSTYNGGRGETSQYSTSPTSRPTYPTTLPRGETNRDSQLNFSSAQGYDNIGVTIEDDDMLMTAM